MRSRHVNLAKHDSPHCDPWIFDELLKGRRVDENNWVEKACRIYPEMKT